MRGLANILRHAAGVATVLCFLLTTAIFAQFDTATVLGTVRDDSGNAVVGARVTLTNLGTGIEATATTDENGAYQFLNVKLGTYKVSAEAKGFSTAVASGITATVGARQRVDLTLKVGALTETVQVTDAASLVETETSDRGQIINRQQIVELPLNGRQYSALALLSTGIRQSTLAQNVDSQGGDAREGSFNANGLRSTFNNFLLDGVDNNSYGTSNQNFSNQAMQVSPDALEEFKVVTNNMSAEFGRSGGAVINASVKSGTNQLHGSLWEFVRNTNLNAIGFFKPLGGVKPVLQRNQFGGVVGGPIRRNKTFFFLSYEGFREVSRVPVFSSLPTLNDRIGLFDKPVRNPLTNETFAANTPIPTNKITPFGLKVLADLPTPTIAGRANNFQYSPRSKDFNDKFDLKFDHHFNARINAFMRIGQRKSNVFNEPVIPGPSGGSGNGFTRVLNQQLAGAVTWTPTASSLLEFRLGLTRTRAGKQPVGIGGPSMKTLFGITGLPEDATLTGPLTTQNITGFTSLGRRASNPQWQHPFVVNPKVNYSFMLGRHSLKTGYEYQRIHTEIMDVNPLYGQDVYGGNFSRPTNGVADSATYNVADFLFGLRSQYQLVNFFIAQYRQRMHFGYVQDDFKVNSKLTLNLGMRYEYATPQWERDNRVSNFDPATNAIVTPTGNSLAQRSLLNPDRNNWGPRIGFAYSGPFKVTARGGFGISYNHFNRAGTSNLLAVNGPQVVNGVTNQLPTDATFRTTLQGYPADFTSPSSFRPLNASVKYIPRDLPSSYVQSWFLSLQREVARNTLVDIAYVGNRAVKLPMVADLNQARPNGTTENATLQARRRIATFAAINAYFPGGWSNYHGLQARIERRVAGGLYVLNSFTWSKAMDNSSQVLENPNGNSPGPQNYFNLAAEKGVSAYDQTLTNVTSVVWDAPLGKGRRFGDKMPAVADAVVGGWQLSFINDMWSGQPITLTYSPAAAFQVGSSNPRPNVVGEVLAPDGQRTITNYFNAANVVIPTDRSQPFGNAGRNIARSHSFYQVDLGLHKNFRLPWEGTKLQFRGEFFNLLNKTNFFPADGNRSNASFGAINRTFAPRQIQLALKLTF
ncbi:MAG: TonB-dependent receptor [Acidobacteria bacterium]|nr:TonB-dependent receptor [Acidobacteriota bacterium]MBI3427132.1 TonB-dependent receptor [Acidobacteriota bacterium]